MIEPEQSRQQERSADNRPWGTYVVLDEGLDFKVKLISVRPGKRLSYQFHRHRSEHWFVIRGRGLATVNDLTVDLRAGDSLDVPIGVPHRIDNPGRDELVFVEVQHGQYFGEDDIVRLDDDFGRPVQHGQDTA